VRFTVATYNIHKGFSGFMKRVVIHELRERLHGLDADIVFLQEVQGLHDRHAGRYHNWPTKPQHEYIADSNWREVAYGKNATYRDGHHGNALLSRYAIVAQDNEDISAHAFESRGLLHCIVELGAKVPALHCINVHLGLFERGRQWQLRALAERIRANVPDDAPLVIAGDFNDWRHKANRVLCDQLGVVEVFEAVKGRPARTFPSVMPVFRLDRIYARHLKVVEAHVHCAFPAAKISDHAALAATFELAARRS
jgi:endonuclease/exonuclease/phosphatase family metal-dependent hydrolase